MRLHIADSGVQGQGGEASMQGSFLRFYVNAAQEHHGVLLWEWLLDQGNKLGIRGG